MAIVINIFIKRPESAYLPKPEEGNSLDQTDRSLQRQWLLFDHQHKEGGKVQNYTGQTAAKSWIS